MKPLYKLLGLGLVMYISLVAAGFSVSYIRDLEKNPDLEPAVNAAIAGEPIDIADVSLGKLKIKNRELFFYDGQIKRQVVYRNNPISNLVFSPSRDRFGYLVNYSIYDENIPYDKTTILRIEDADTRVSKQVYHGSFRTSGWEWFSDNEVLVSEGCGTECQAQFLINLEYGKQYTLQYGVGYQWSPNKKMVVAYNYSLRRGITVGDKFGKKLFRYVLTPRNDTHFANTPQALWSPDSNKLAVAMEKETGEGFDLLVFGVKKNFKKILRSDIGSSDKFELAWSEDSKKVFVNGLALEE